MVRWGLCVRAFVIAFSLSVMSNLPADETAAPQSGVTQPQAEAGGQSTAAKPGPPQDAPTRSAIEKVFHAQQDAWNGGDIDAFMDHYWKSDDLTFSSNGKTTRGWQATLTHYREQYPTREKMGHLTLSKFEITPLGDAAALVLGQWKLDRQNEPIGGNFTLVLRKIDGKWVIVHDHTSRSME